jgi:acyl-CoA synthetase (AMP-forming)/AMP-acid ligase II/enoyl-CoA hydratase/carnithine racemase
MIFKSPHSDVDIPEIPLHQLVLKNCSRLGDKAAFIDAPTGRTVTYKQMAIYVDRMAAYLASTGFAKHDVLALYSPNVPEYPAVFLGTSAAGGTITTVNPLSSAEDLAHQLKATGAKKIVTIPPFMEKAAEAAKNAPTVNEIIVIGEAPGAISLCKVLQTDAKSPVIEFDVHQDVVALPFSSGTTGLPKGVMLTHYNLVANILQSMAIKTSDEVDVICSVLPFFHIYGMTVLVSTTMVVGATTVTLPQFDAEVYLKAMQDYKATETYVAPPLVLMLAKHPLVDKFDLKTLQLVYSGAAPLDAALAKACEDRLNCVVTQGYGMTEASPGTHSGYRNAEKNKAGSVGQLMPNTVCRIVDVDTKKDLESMQDGELFIKGPQIMKGYLNSLEQTRQMLDEDGWLHTGDIGRFDEDGFCYVVDRVKELIKYKGFQVAPAELEGLLLSHPAISDVAVVPVPDAEAGEIPMAFVVKKSEIAANELMDFVASKVTSYKRIRAIEFVETIPKSASGKILKRVLVDNLRLNQSLKSVGIERIEDRITIERRGKIMLIGLDRPHKLNAFDPAMFIGLAKALTAVDEDKEINCSVLFAHGDSFTAGIDIAASMSMFATGEAFLPEGCVDPWGVTGGRDRVKPLVMAVHGRCYTLAIELALATDCVIAADDTKFCQLEVSRGIMPFGGATLRLPLYAGWSNAMRYLLTGDEFDAHEAYRLNIVQEVVPLGKQLERAIAIAERIAAQAPLAVQATIASARQLERDGFSAAAKNMGPTVRKLLKSQDCAEGVRSFLEKRAPKFEGK